MNADIYLYPAAANPNDIILSWGLRDTSAHDWLPPRREQAPTWPKVPVRVPEPVIVAQSLYDDLVARYGKLEGRRIYFEMQAEYKGPFAPGAKYDATVRDVPSPLAAPRRRAPVINNVPPARRN